MVLPDPTIVMWIMTVVIPNLVLIVEDTQGNLANQGVDHLVDKAVEPLVLPSLLLMLIEVQLHPIQEITLRYPRMNIRSDRRQGQDMYTVGTRGGAKTIGALTIPRTGL